MVKVQQEDPTQDDMTGLLKQSHALMESLFPSDENHFLSVEALTAPEIRFFGARDGEGQALGCAALAKLDGYGEVKSMFVATEARGQGVANALLTRIEEEARALGLPLLRLETGDVLHEAHRLYGRHGFKLRGPFGAYPEAPSSLFMEKRLS